jgi:hypothetical protein
MSNDQRYLLAQRLPAVSPALAFLASHPGRPGHFRIDIPAGVDAAAQQAYLRDQQVVAQLQHPHILPLVETAAMPDGTPICVSRLPGMSPSTLQARLNAGPPLTPAAARAIVTAVADALAAAHTKGVSHGRVGADQVLLSTDDGPAGGPWLFGFGARHLLDLGLDAAGDCARDLADLEALARQLRGPLPSAAEPQPEVGEAQPNSPGDTSKRRVGHWVGLGVGAALGAAVTALVLLPMNPLTAQAVRDPLAPGPTPAVAEPAPTAEPTPAVAEPAPMVAEPAPVVAEPTPAVAEPATPAEPAPAVAVDRAPVAVQPPADRPPVVTTKPRPRPRTAPPAPVRRGLVWSARAQKLVQVDEQGLALEQPAASPPPVSGAPGTVAPADASTPQVVR